LEAPLLGSDVSIRPWRTATLVTGLIAAVEFVALLVLGAMLLAKPISRAVLRQAQASASAPAPTTAKVAKTAVAKGTPAVPKHLAAVKPKLSRGRTGILVLNGNGRTGAASAEAASLQRLGYPPATTGNAVRHDYATTVIMYRKGMRAEALRLARDLHVKVVGPLDGLRPAALHSAKLAVILGVG
jgi:LytR cell envelope-related transcriptional attenuator